MRRIAVLLVLLLAAAATAGQGQREQEDVGALKEKYVNSGSSSKSSARRTATR